MKRKGFTVTEVLVALTIICILVLLAIPPYTKWKNGGEYFSVETVTQPYKEKHYLCIDGYKYLYIPEYGLVQQFKNVGFPSDRARCIPCVEETPQDDAYEESKPYLPLLPTESTNSKR